MISGDAVNEPLLTRAARGYRATLASQAIRVLCKAGAVVIVARLVTPADHGRFAMAASVFFVLVLFRDAGLGPAAVQARELSEEQCSTLWHAHLWLGIVLGVIAVGLAPIAAWFYHEPQVIGLLASMGVAFVLLGLNAWPRVLLSRELRFVEINRMETIAAVLATLAMIVAAAAGAGPYTFVVFLVGTEAVLLVMAWRLCRWRPAAAARWRSVAGFWHAGADVTGYQLLMAVGQQLDSLLMGRWFGAAPLGFYNRPNQLLALPNQHVCAPIVQVLMATLARIGPAGPDFVPHVRQTTNLIGYLTLPLATICAVLPNEVVRLVLGAAWPEAAPLLRWLSISWAATYPASVLYALCVAAGNTRRLTFISAAAVLANLAGLWVGRSYGPTGLAAGVALANVATLVPRMWWSVRATPVKLQDLANALSGPIGTALVFGAGLSVGHLLAFSGILLPLASGLGCGVAAVGILCIVWPRARVELAHVWAYRPRH